MTEPIDGYLDGTLDQAALTPEEREHAHATERIIEETRAFLAARPVPDLTPRVMRRIQELGIRPGKPRVRSTLRRLAHSIWAPRSVELQWRPAYAVFAAAAVILLVVSLPYGWRTPAPKPPTVAAADTGARLFVQFRLEAAGAMDVRLAGSFTNWQPRYELHQASPGIWTITVPLSAGVHDYVFVVDGQKWIPDPYAQHVDDGFGGMNSRIALVPPDQSRS
jgi:anti-sigma-K factor RskA